MRIEARLCHDPIDPGAELTSFSSDGAGAMVSFTGIARGTSKAGEKVTKLFLDHHPRLTPASLDTIASVAAKRFDLLAILVLHRAGDVAPGEPIVLVAAAAAHRRAAFEAVDYAMDRLKTDAIFWKREDGFGGSAWIEPTDHDRVARARWED